eukprot:m.235034 g.235034  ORF g.235034 m.235034 type:complete len:1295 (+) comp16039_c0_seq3:221-4105(+)
MPSNIVKFVRGLDLSRNDYRDVENFPDRLSNYENLQWLRVRDSGLSTLPTVVSKMSKLEHLSLDRNMLQEVPQMSEGLESLRTLKLSENQLTEEKISRDIFKRMKALVVVNLEGNSLTSIPACVGRRHEDSEGLLALNVAKNNISFEAQNALSKDVFNACKHLHKLNLSRNNMTLLPIQLYRFKDLQTLDLSFNPFEEGSFAVVGLRGVSVFDGMTQLRSLRLRSVGHQALKDVSNDLGNKLLYLSELDLGENHLEEIPQWVLGLNSLRRLYLDGNELENIQETAFDNLQALETLNLSRNKLASLPSSIANLKLLRKLFANDNKLKVLPKGLSQLQHMSILRLSRNNISKLDLDILQSKTITLHITGNPISAEIVLKKPSKLNSPKTETKISPAYEIHFEHIQMKKRKWNPNIPQAPMGSPKKAMGFGSPSKLVDRKEDIRSKQILQGLVDVAKSPEKRKIPNFKLDTEVLEEELKSDQSTVSHRKWNEAGLFGTSASPLDYSNLFGNNVGKHPGISVWKIVNFVPVEENTVTGFGFAENDCYLVLHAQDIVSETHSAIDTQVFFWVGAKSSLDKKASVAIHAVHLRNYVGSKKCSQREEQGSESAFFSNLFSGNVCHKPGGTESGFFRTEEEVHINRMYRLEGCPVQCTPVLPSRSSLQQGSTLLLDTENTIFLWRGANVKYTSYQISRLFAVKYQTTISKKKELVEIQQNEDSLIFFQHLENLQSDNSSSEMGGLSPRLFEVHLGHGCLELPQAVLRNRKKKFPIKKLASNKVVIVDAGADMYVWHGHHSSRLDQAAAGRLIPELQKMAPRPKHTVVTIVNEGQESLMFKSMFDSWDDVIQSDHRSMEYRVAKEKNISEPLAALDVDIGEAFSPREPAMEQSRAETLEKQWKTDLEKTDAYILDKCKKNFVRLPKTHHGVFYSQDCYVFLCKEWRVIQQNESGTKEQGTQEVQEELCCTAYFWQGRDSGKLGWLTFSFSFRPQMEKLIFNSLGCKLAVVHEYQFQESMRFMALFDKTMMLYTGSHSNPFKDKAQLFHQHSWLPTTFSRCIQVPCTVDSLDQNDCFLLRVPLGDEPDLVYIWEGQDCSPDDAAIIASIAKTHFEGSTVRTITEGKFDDRIFCKALGVAQEAPPMLSKFHGISNSRLFSSSCGSGKFVVSEVRPQFCQDHLSEQEGAILETPDLLFIWFGPLSSSAVVELTMATGKEMLARQNFPQKQIKVVHKGQEPQEFVKCFHGWSRNILSSLDLGRPVQLQKDILAPLPPRPEVTSRHDDSPFALHVRGKQESSSDEASC